MIQTSAKKNSSSYLVLTHFDELAGPTTLISLNSKIPADMRLIIGNLMDLELPETYFELEVKQKFPQYKFVNYYFEISSPLARGKQEMLLLTGIMPRGFHSLF